MKIFDLTAIPVSMVTGTEPELQRVDLTVETDFSGHLRLQALQNGRLVADNMDLPVQAGKNCLSVLLPPPDRKAEGTVRLFASSGELLKEWNGVWEPPRHWTLYVMQASHTDIGLHNSQYFQRWQSENFLDEAMAMADSDPDYRYVMEGTWFWNNYGMDRGRAAAEKVRDQYIRTGRIGLFCGMAGNHTQTYGLEEMCRSAGNRKRLREQWGIDSHTMSMIDNNGMSWALIEPYAEAGVRNLFFAPNQWNPLPSTVWKCDVTVPKYQWTPEAGGGGSRIDVRYESDLPMVFWWQGPDQKSRLLVWTSTHYNHGAACFGLHSDRSCSSWVLREMEHHTARTLGILEKKYPFDLWLCACYNDDETPHLRTVQTLREWNRRWKWPRFRMLGDPDEPFERLRERFGAQIPVLSGDITGGWYQHPLSAPDCLADKFEADRALPSAEKIAVLAAAADPEYRYPAEGFRRAWHALMLNDEHSYGTSGYQGRKVYETWLQHREWIRFASRTASEETDRALTALGAKINTEAESLLLFNPSAFPRREILNLPEGGVFRTPEVPAFGYRAFPLSEIQAVPPKPEKTEEPPVVENSCYRIRFAPDGSFESIYDKEFRRELLDPSAPFRGNQFVYTDDNHRTFHTPEKAVFEVSENSLQTVVTVHTVDPVSGAEILSTVTLPAGEKRIDLDNRLNHVRDLVNAHRYYRYGYYAFPFQVENGSRKVHLNGCIASPGRGGQTGHGTETYLAAREWSCVENGSFGAALLQLDSQLVEFDHIHPDKTDCFMNETGSRLYAALFNDWLQMHVPGGSHINLRFRFSITSYGGDFRTAGVTHLAERMANPLLMKRIGTHAGPWPESRSLLSLPDGLRLLAVKRSDDGSGIVFRVQEMHGKEMPVKAPEFLGKKSRRVTVDERLMETDSPCHAFGTASFQVDLRIPEQTFADPVPGPVPAAVGSWYTELITEPCICCGAENGQLYLIWGQNQEKDLSHYELYRSETSGFEPGPDTMIAKVEPGPYRTALYEETGLKTHTRYYYRVRAVNAAGIPGPMSGEFSGITREI